MFQHYVPHVYLQKFTDPGTPSEHDEYLWVWDMHERTVVRRAPKNVAGETNYYESIGVTGGPGSGVEGRLGKIESRVKAELDRLHAERERALGFDDRLLWFLATLSVRTPWAQRAVERHIDLHPPAGLMSTLGSHEQWAASVEYLASWSYEYFRRMEWILVGPIDSSLYFVTSDRPVVLTSESMDGSIMDLMRLTEDSSVVTVPLSPQLALIGSYRRDEIMQTEVTVDWINRRTVEHAERFVFMSCKPSAWIAPTDP